jgi:hypothetical protein
LAWQIFEHDRISDWAQSKHGVNANAFFGRAFRILNHGIDAWEWWCKACKKDTI